MENTINDFVNVICLRNQLLVVPFEKFVKLHRDKEKFITFLDTFAVLTEVDSAFLLFSDEVLEKVENVMYDNRFKYEEAEIVEAINQAIAYLNSIRAYEESNKNLLKYGYLSYQEECRKTSIDSERILFDTLATDAVVYLALEEDRMDLLDGTDEFFIASINYFMEAVPELFDNSEIKGRALKKLEEISTKGWPFKRSNREYSKETIKNMQKIKLRGE